MNIHYILALAVGCLGSLAEARVDYIRPVDVEKGNDKLSKVTKSSGDKSVGVKGGVTFIQSHAASLNEWSLKSSRRGRYTVNPKRKTTSTAKVSKGPVFGTGVPKTGLFKKRRGKLRITTPPPQEKKKSKFSLFGKAKTKKNETAANPETRAEVKQKAPATRAERGRIAAEERTEKRRINEENRRNERFDRVYDNDDDVGIKNGGGGLGYRRVDGNGYGDASYGDSGRSRSRRSLDDDDDDGDSDNGRYGGAYSRRGTGSGSGSGYGTGVAARLGGEVAGAAVESAKGGFFSRHRNKAMVGGAAMAGAGAAVGLGAGGFALHNRMHRGHGDGDADATEEGDVGVADGEGNEAAPADGTAEGADSPPTGGDDSAEEAGAVDSEDEGTSESANGSDAEEDEEEGIHSDSNDHDDADYTDADDYSDSDSDDEDADANDFRGSGNVMTRRDSRFESGNFADSDDEDYDDDVAEPTEEEDEDYNRRRRSRFRGSFLETVDDVADDDDADDDVNTMDKDAIDRDGNQEEEEVDNFKTPSGLEYLGAGYDLLTGNPFGDSVTLLDPGYRANILQMHWSLNFEGVSNSMQYLQPLGAWIRPYPSCNKVEALTEVKDENVIQADAKADASVTLELPGDAARFAVSNSFKNFAKNATCGTTKTYYNKSYCFKYVAGLPTSINWDFTLGFQAALDGVEKSASVLGDESKCPVEVYLKDPHDVACGKILVKLEAKSSDVAEAKESSRNFELELQAQIKDHGLDVGTHVTEYKPSKSSNIVMDMKKTTFAVGGDIYGFGKPLTFEEWAQTVYEFAMPIKAEYSPLLEFLPTETAAAFEVAYLYYSRYLVAKAAADARGDETHLYLATV